MISIFNNFTEEARKILIRAKEEMHELKHPYVGSEHLLLAILKDDNNISKKLKEYDFDYHVFKEEIINVVGVGTKANDYFLYTPLLKRVMEGATIDSKENNNGEVTINHLFSSLLEEGEGVAIRIMLGMNIDIDNLYNEFAYKVNNKVKKHKKLLLEELGIDLTNKALNNELDPVVGRDKEIKRIIEILSRRTKNNPILIGEAGVGKTSIIEELSQMIVKCEVPLSLKNKRIISLDMATSVAGTKYRGEFEERIKKILKEVEENDEIILFIDEIHTLVGAGGAEGAIDAANIFKPALARNKLRCIGATTLDEYKKYIENDRALDRRFQKVFIEAPSMETLKQILIKLKPIYESYHKVIINDDIIDLIIDLSEKYIYDRNQPDKAIDIMDEVAAKVSLMEEKELTNYRELNKQLQTTINHKNDAIINNDFQLASKHKKKENLLMDKINNLEMKIYNQDTIKIVTKEDIASIISLKTKIPVYELLNESSSSVNNFKNNLNEIIGQEKTIDALIKISKKIKLGFKQENRCYSMMFVGNSGVGKTELAKIFSNNLVGQENVIKLDMSEYSEGHSISKIVGAPPGYVGYSDNKNILEEIRNHPNSVLILDEIEKAHQNIINLLFQVLDDGKIKDSKGNIVRFDNVIIIMTSNIGFNDCSIGFNKNEHAVLTKLKESFSISFINRIDNVLIFDDLNQKKMEQIINKKLERLKERYKKKEIVIKIDEGIVGEILELSNYQEFGARKIDKIINDNLDNLIIDKVIDNQKNITIITLKESSIN
ncbi:MAG: ATP-dependent Clp protease ATP-binding subunit [Bacilli bacterium]|nr:ATP-dependent Clp protease ATP-binding subunit [Bacilli bacterium]MDD4809370.1 ATP-dependent Clp protease ATP-binding subunit [Bacilli bacterium]